MKGGAQRFHEWRKAHKYHGFHIDLLKRSAPDVLGPQLDLADRLSTLLGQHHDLAVLGETVVRDPQRLGPAADVALLSEMSDRRRSAIELQVVELARQIYAETPGAMASRFANYWSSVP